MSSIMTQITTKTTVHAIRLYYYYRRDELDNLEDQRRPLLSFCD